MPPMARVGREVEGPEAAPLKIAVQSRSFAGANARPSPKRFQVLFNPLVPSVLLIIATNNSFFYQVVHSSVICAGRAVIQTIEQLLFGHRPSVMDQRDNLRVPQSRPFLLENIYILFQEGLQVLVLPVEIIQCRIQGFLGITADF